MKCSICGRILKKPESRQLGYGPVCYRRVFGDSKSRENARKGDSLSDVACPCYDIPGQMSLDEYLADIS